MMPEPSLNEARVLVAVAAFNTAFRHGQVGAKKIAKLIERVEPPPRPIDYQLDNLRRRGLLRCPKRGGWQVTAAGRRWLAGKTSPAALPPSRGARS